MSSDRLRRRRRRRPSWSLSPNPSSLRRPRKGEVCGGEVCGHHHSPVVRVPAVRFYPERARACPPARSIVEIVSIGAAPSAPVFVTQRNTTAWTIGVPKDRTRVVVVGTPSSCGCARANASVESARSRRCECHQVRVIAAHATREYSVNLAHTAAVSVVSRTMAVNPDSSSKCLLPCAAVVSVCVTYNVCERCTPHSLYAPTVFNLKRRPLFLDITARDGRASQIIILCRYNVHVIV